MEDKINKSKKEVKESIEELLIRLRKERGWSHTNLLQHLEDKSLTEKDIRKWEIGLKYPNLNMIYELSGIYQIPSEKFIEAKNISFEKGVGSINIVTIKWICYFLNVSIKVGVVILVLLYIVLLILSLLFFTTMASNVKKAF